MASSSPSLLLLSIPPLLLSYTLFLLLSPPPSPLHSIPSISHRSLLQIQSSPPPCTTASLSPLTYLTLHSCLFNGDKRVSLPFLSLLLLFYFRILALAAGRHFSPAVSRLAARLRLSPSMAAVTLLALGNGAPDAFSSAAALRSGLPRTGLAAILSAGAFVSAFVVGSVAIQSAPFSLKPAPFIRDIFFYLISSSALFYVYLSAEIFLWQAVGFVVFYLFFVGFVVYMDYWVADERGEREVELEMGKLELKEEREEGDLQDQKFGSSSSFSGLMCKITTIWELPASTLLKLTIPPPLPSKSKKFYTLANITLCPVIILFSLSSLIPIDIPIVFLIPKTHFPLWSVVLFVSLCIALSHFFFEKETLEEEEKSEEYISVTLSLISFIMSVFWISTTAGELLNCLLAIGSILDLPPAILGLTVLAWGNSIGDLVADVALAKAGQPAIAMAGCFAGPMFNMSVGLGTALVIQTARVYPNAYKLKFSVSIVFAFVFLLLSLMGSLLVVTWSRFRVPRFWGYCLVGLYLLFTGVSLILSRFT